MSRLIKVKNRSNGGVVYRIPERNNLRREFTPKEEKTIEYDELVALTGIAGGRELIYNFLYISDQEALRELLNIKEEPEYWITEDKLPEWMAKCSLDEFKDGLDFMPVGLTDLVKKLAVDMPLNDVAKRKAIREMLDFDVDGAIAINELAAEDNGAEEAPAASASKRRSSATTATLINTPKIVIKQ